MKLFFKFIGRAFSAFFLHQYLSVKFFLVNLWKAFYHPNNPHDVRTKPPRAYARELQERWSSVPRFIGPTSDNAGTPIKKKRKHRGGRKHRRKRFNNNKPTK